MKQTWGVAVKPEARARLCDGWETWVKTKDHAFYVGVKDRGEWATRKEAVKHISNKDVETVVEIFR
jgi:hypothetical protein